MLTRSRLLTRDKNLYMGVRVRKESCKDKGDESRIEFLNVCPPATLPYSDGKELRARLLNCLLSDHLLTLVLGPYLSAAPASITDPRWAIYNCTSASWYLLPLLHYSRFVAPNYISAASIP